MHNRKESRRRRSREFDFGHFAETDIKSSIIMQDLEWFSFFVEDRVGDYIGTTATTKPTQADN